MAPSGFTAAATAAAAAPGRLVPGRNGVCRGEPAPRPLRLQQLLEVRR